MLSSAQDRRASGMPTRSPKMIAPSRGIVAGVRARLRLCKRADRELQNERGRQLRRLAPQKNSEPFRRSLSAEVASSINMPQLPAHPRGRQSDVRGAISSAPKACRPAPRLLWHTGNTSAANRTGDELLVANRRRTETIRPWTVYAGAVDAVQQAGRAGFARV
jgi:hypothetical protein